VSRNRIVYIAVSLAVSAVLVAILFSQVRAQDFGRTLAAIYVPSLLVYMAVSLVAAWLRAWRYKWLLAPENIGWGNMFLVTFVRNSFEDLLPARIGSLSYIYILNKRLGFSFESAASTFVVALVFDFLTLYPFLIVAALAAGWGSEAISAEALLVAAGFFFAVFGIIVWKLIPLSRLALKAFAGLLRVFGWSERPKSRASLAKLGSTIDSLEAIRRRRIYGRLFGLSLLIRFCKYVSLFALFFALIQSQGFTLADLSFGKIILGVTGAEMTSALPIKGLAGFGTWESAWVVALRLMRFDPRLAVLTGLGIHLLSNVFEYSLGLTSLVVLLFPYLNRKKA
jgi:uncharacterized membrane protein YbhN (UPF0104 family)